MSGLVIAVAAVVVLLVLTAGYLLVRRRRSRRPNASSTPDGAVRMDVPDEEFWRWKPRKADDRRLPPQPRRRILRRRVPSSS